MEGSYRFLRRVWNLGYKFGELGIRPMQAANQSEVQFGEGAKEFRREIYTILKQVDHDYERMQYNTVVSGAMKMLNTLEADAKFWGPYSLDELKEFAFATLANDPAMAGIRVALAECFGILLRCLYPAAPHITSQLWSELGYAEHFGDLLDTAWPTIDESALQRDQIELMLQINGKLRGSVTVSATASKEQIEQAALATEAFIKQANGAAPKKVIVVPGRLVNIVV